MREGASLARYTSARIGGPADYLIEARSAGELAEIARKLWALLVADAGYRGVVVVNQAQAVTFADEGAGRVLCSAESGANLGALARRCVRRGLAGLEWAATVPGTVGGAVVGNAGAHGGDIAGALRMADILQRSGERGWLPAAALGYEYRSSRLKRAPGQEVVLAAQFSLERGDRQAAQAKVEAFSARRKRSQPPGASMGSMFKNPPGDYAGRLIEAAGLKGARIGKAEISSLHANFFVNPGGARAEDVLALIRLAQERVKQQFGVTLELEVELVGEW
ncbi:MAG: UDP-N-acetylmuramate dehydrogenase [Chloroflexi bacterium]|nr:UDP-N-acetylmuramate dehydrogenase [Chloroflexota bacterium]